jgi:AcrR family transcriptional regulator
MRVRQEPGPGRGARERVLAAAGRLFATRGISATTMEEVAVGAPVSKRTLYAHFPTKDDLVLGQLQHVLDSGETLLGVLTREDLSPRERLLGMFDPSPEVGGIARGCPFIDAAAEYPLPASRVHAFARQQKLLMYGLVRDLTERLGVAEPERLAEHLVTLADGASSRAMVLDDRDYGRHARTAAESLIDLAPRRPVPPGPAQVTAGSQPANDRHGTRQAPGRLAFVQELLNTRSDGRSRHPDPLAGLPSGQQWVDRALTAWSVDAGIRAEPVVLGVDDVAHLRQFRDDLHERVSGAEGLDLVGVGDTASASLQMVESGEVRLVPGGTGWRYIVSLALITAQEAQLAETWHRLKVCRNPSCGIAFYDRSRNNSGVWHDVRVCGNAANLRAHRARRRAELPPS